MHTSSLENMKYFVDRYLSGMRSCRILDLGSQVVEGESSGSYRQLFERDGWVYEGADIVPGINVDIVLRSPYRWKEIGSKTYDCVACGQMFEHDEFFWLTMLEIYRILKPGGLCCIIAPSGGMEHRYPVDCYRYYPDGLKAAARYAGFDVLEAYAQWNPELYPEMDSMWRDCVLVARRPENGWRSTLSAAVSRCLVQRGSRKACETRYGNDYTEKTTWTFPVPAAYCALYWDFGAGYSEKNVTRIRIPMGEISVSIQVPEGVRAIRFDPVEGYRCAVRDLCVRLNGAPVDFTVKNGEKAAENLVVFFNTTDPQILLSFSTEIRGKLEITGRAYMVR